MHCKPRGKGPPHRSTMWATHTRTPCTENTACHPRYTDRCTSHLCDTSTLPSLGKTLKLRGGLACIAHSQCIWCSVPNGEEWGQVSPPPGRALTWTQKNPLAVISQQDGVPGSNTTQWITETQCLLGSKPYPIPELCYHISCFLHNHQLPSYSSDQTLIPSCA